MEPRDQITITTPEAPRQSDPPPVAAPVPRAPYVPPEQWYPGRVGLAYQLLPDLSTWVLHRVDQSTVEREVDGETVLEPNPHQYVFRSPRDGGYTWLTLRGFLDSVSRKWTWRAGPGEPYEVPCFSCCLPVKIQAEVNVVPVCKRCR